MTLSRFLNRAIIRELLVVLAFAGFTSLLTWPYVTRLRDVVVDKGDPYLIAWILWWDYHQTFTDPLNLFNANIFYPLKYTLAFSEHSYGIALLFFPLYAIGMTPLTVHAVALFFAFVVDGYSAFRLGRTLTSSAAVGWVAGVIFAFVPYRFNMMSQVAYVFSPWMPLVFEALVLFVRSRSNKRAAWLGFCFFMNGLSTITWFNLTLIPLALYAAILLTRHRIWRDRHFWVRASVALLLAMVALLPFMVPYVVASRIYNFKRSIEEIKQNSAMPVHWLSVENRNKLWNRMGEGVHDGYKFKLFPGLLPILFSLATLAKPEKAKYQKYTSTNHRAWIPRLDALIIGLFSLSLLSIGFDHSTAFYNLFDYFPSEYFLTLLTVAIFSRLCIAYPVFLNAVRPNLVETIRSNSCSDAFWLGLLLTITGFCLSLGWNFFPYRICYQLIPLFKSMRVVTRVSVVAYLGLAILAGLGVRRLAEAIKVYYPRVQEKRVVLVACVLLLFELNAAPLQIVRGESFPDAVTLRLKRTPMRGGIVQLPTGGDNNYRYTLRAADHQKPLVVGTSGFVPPNEAKIDSLTSSGAIPDELMTFMEVVPTSYLVIGNQSIQAERMPDYQAFLARQLKTGRLRFINRFDGRDDLYAVVKNEPDAKGEAALPFDLSVKDWAGLVQEDPVRMLGAPLNISQRLYRVYRATFGTMPRYKEFQRDLDEICRGVIVGSENQQAQFGANLEAFMNDWPNRARFQQEIGALNDTQYVDRLLENTGMSVTGAERQQLATALSNAQYTRASILLKIVDDPRFVEKERKPSLVALHYFGYLRRNPDDPPDGDLRGFNFWLNDLEHNTDPNKLPTAFSLTPEHKQFTKKP